MKLTLDQNTLEIVGAGREYLISLGGTTFRVEVLHSANGRLDLRLNGRRVVAYVSREGNKRWVTVHGQTFLLTQSSGRTASGSGRDATSHLLAPMPGQVRSVNVEQGQAVIRGQTLLVLEAMKMEIRIQAPADGVVTQLFVQAGQTVEREQALVHFEPHPLNP